MDSLLVEVVLPVPGEKSFTYAVPDGLKSRVEVGSRALVPLGNRTVTGVIVARDVPPFDGEMRKIIDILDDIPSLTSELLKLTRWVATYYLCGWGEVLKAALPAGIDWRSRTRVRLAALPSSTSWRKLEMSSPQQAQVLRLLKERGEQTLFSLQRSLQNNRLPVCVEELSRKGYVKIVREIRPPRTRVKRRKIARVLDPDRARTEAMELGKRAPQQAHCLMILLQNGGAMPISWLLREHRIDGGVVQRLRSRRLLETCEEEVIRDPFDHPPPLSPLPLELTPAQRDAYNQICHFLERREYKSVLLYGVTASGKTEVYLRAVARALSMGRGAIVLVPEIALTPQLVSRFRERFGRNVAVLHSRLSLGERFDVWRQIRSGAYRVVVGVRSAVFAPVDRLGVIVVDEEHEPSYKQDDPNPRYHARDVAVIRARLNRAVAILGSATPSLESYRNALVDKYVLCSLPKRIDDRPLPPVHVVDMREERKRGNWGIFSRHLQDRIENRLEKGEQIILFLNRRGYSTLVSCQECGFIALCPRCRITLTFHLHDESLRCHYCGYKRRMPETCPRCRGMKITYKGVGTQRVEKEVKRAFPEAVVSRMDVDSTTRKGSHRKLYEMFSAGTTDILLGTQMVAKGFDFPNVTLVGVISADVGLNMPDFRAGERTFQLLAQVSGRTGRGERGGEVVIQTYTPDDSNIRWGTRQDYVSFYLQEVREREELGYPPFSRLILIGVRSRNEGRVERAAGDIAQRLRKALKGSARPTEVLGPAPAPLSKLKDVFRWQILVKFSDFPGIGKVIRGVISRSPLAEVRVSIDVDPVDMM